MLLLIVALVCAISQEIYGQTNAPVPEILTAVNTAYGALVKWKLEPPELVDKIIITYEGDDLTSEKMEVSGSHTEAILPLIRPCTSYTIMVTSFVAGLNEMSSEKYEFKGPVLPLPSRPTNLRITQEPTGRVLHWDRPENPGTIRNYNIFGKGGEDEEHRLIVTYDRTSEPLSSFHFHHEYQLWMTAENLCGPSENSEVILVTQFSAPPAPVISGAVPGTRSIRITFTKGTGEGRVDSFLVQYKKENGELYQSTLSSSAEDALLTEGIIGCRKYTIELFAVNAAGRSEPAVVTAFAISEASTLPEKPNIPTVIEVGNDVYVSWIAQDTVNVEFYEVHYSTLQGESKFVTVAGNRYAATLKNLKKCQTYQVKIRSQSKCGWSEYSDTAQISLKPAGKPTKPASFTAAGNGKMCILSWDKGDTEELRTQYELATSRPLGESQFFWISSDATEYTLKNLGRNKEYFLMLWAKNSCGWSEPSELHLKFDNAYNMEIL